MKMLLDENVPFRLYQDFGNDHEVYSVKYMSWRGLNNGALLKLMLAENFEALITVDQNIGFSKTLKPIPLLFSYCAATTTIIKV